MMQILLQEKKIKTFHVKKCDATHIACCRNLRQNHSDSWSSVGGCGARDIRAMMVTPVTGTKDPGATQAYVRLYWLATDCSCPKGVRCWVHVMIAVICAEDSDKHHY